MDLDVFAPSNIRAQYITLELANPLDRRLALSGIELTVSLILDAADVGLVAPVILSVMSPSQVYTEKVFRTRVPSSVSFVPHEGGQYLVTLRESAHNRWWGALVVVVEGATEQDT